jgi:hypothetical protein
MRANYTPLNHALQKNQVSKGKKSMKRELNPARRPLWAVRPGNASIHPATRRVATYLLCGVLLLAFAGGTSARANTLHVNTTADLGGAGVCALRDAITAATTDTAVNGCPAGSGADTIVFDVSGTITLGSPLLDQDPTALTIDGTGRSIILDGHQAAQAFILNTATLNLKYLTIANGFATNGGGGAIFIFGVGSAVSVLNSTFSNNVSGCGGAIESEGASSLTIANSTFYGNGATTQGCGSASGYGGALLATDTAVTIVNSTFSGNLGVGGQVVVVRGGFTLANTILTNSLSGPTCNIIESPTLAVSGMNLVGDTSCGSDPQHFTIADPMLGPLADNGGPTQTMALLPGSPAIDAADNAICAAAPVNNLDQRGQFRPADGNNDGIAVCDVGAYELKVLLPFTGFFDPVKNPPVVNAVNAGRAVPVTFSLGGNRGLNILAAGYPQSTQVACSSGSQVGDVLQTSSAGESSLNYDPTSNTYTYVWKTDKSWSNTCRLFTLRLTDGTDHIALFQFK